MEGLKVFQLMLFCFLFRCIQGVYGLLSSYPEITIREVSASFASLSFVFSPGCLARVLAIYNPSRSVPAQDLLSLIE
jgi:hypothetical protein